MIAKKVGIVGYGYVGKAVADLFKKHYQLKIYDPQFSTSSESNIEFVSSIDQLNDCFLGIVCVPTPSKETGECDVSLVDDAVRRLNTELILIKSTVEPGTTDRLTNETKKRIVFSPEYVGESKYWNPFFNDNMLETPFLVLGGEKADREEVLRILLPILGPTKSYYQTSNKNAELIKYITNTFAATKITFVNEMYDLCHSLGADWSEVREGWLLDPRVSKMHTAVFHDNRGFGGKCFPKDLAAIIRSAEKAGYTPDLLKEVQKSNKRFRDKNMSSN